MKSYANENSRNGQKGFTLIETSVALVVMMIGGLGIAAVFAYAIRNNTGARDRAVAIGVAQQEMENLRHRSYKDAALTATVTPVTRQVTSGGRPYSIRTTIQDTATTVKTINIQVTPLNSSNPYLGTVSITSQRVAYSLGIYTGGP